MKAVKTTAGSYIVLSQIVEIWTIKAGPEENNTVEVQISDTSDHIYTVGPSEGMHFQSEGAIQKAFADYVITVCT